MNTRTRQNNIKKPASFYFAGFLIELSASSSFLNLFYGAFYVTRSTNLINNLDAWMRSINFG